MVERCIPFSNIHLRFHSIININSWSSKYFLTVVRKTDGIFLPSNIRLILRFSLKFLEFYLYNTNNTIVCTSQQVYCGSISEVEISTPNWSFYISIIDIGSLISIRYTIKMPASTDKIEDIFKCLYHLIAHRIEGIHLIIYYNMIYTKDFCQVIIKTDHSKK